MRRAIFTITVLLLGGCMSLQDQAKQYCSNKLNQNNCVADYINRAERARANIKGCINTADAVTPMNRQLKRLNCNIGGYINRGHLSGSQSCTPEYEYCKNPHAWDAAFQRCMANNSASIDDSPEFGARVYYDLMRNKNACR